MNLKMMRNMYEMNVGNMMEVNIVIEGSAGSGKNTLAKLIESQLKSIGLNVESKAEIPIDIDTRDVAEILKNLGQEIRVFTTSNIERCPYGAFEYFRDIRKRKE
jgi:Cdc6-like AAA superfamily ATPase